MPPPTNVQESTRKPYWLIQDNKGKTQVVYDPQSEGAWQLGGWSVGGNQAQPDGYEVLYANGELWDYPSEGNAPGPLNPAASQGERIRISTESKQPSDFSLGGARYTYDENGNPVPVVSAQPRVDTRAPYLPGVDETSYREPNPNYLPDSVEWTDESGVQWLIDRNTGRKISRLGHKYIQPPQPAQRAPRWPEEIEESRLDIQKKQRDLMNPYLLQQQQLEEVIGNIKGQLSRGEIDFARANRLMELVRSNTEAALRGTTPWQMQSSKASAAGNILGNESQLGSNLANSFLSGITGMAGNIMAGPTSLPRIDPILLARYGQEQLGAGPQIGGLARSVLSGFLGGT